MGQTGQSGDSVPVAKMQSGEFNRWLRFRSIQTGGAAG